MVRNEAHHAAFQAAAQATRARIRSDRARAPASLKKVFTAVSRRLFHTSLNVNEAWKEAGIKTHTLSKVFKDVAGTSLGQYIAAARIEVACVLMTTTDLDLSTISVWVGYDYHPTFTANFQRVKGELPSQVARVPLTARALIDDEMSLKAGRGLLDPEAMVAHLEALMRLCPVAAKRLREKLCTDDPEPQIIVDGAHTDELKARGLLQQISGLPFEEQRRHVRRHLFYSTVLFDLLRKVSRSEGRKSRQRGIELAELALVSLEGSDQVFGDRIHELRAFGWAWLGNAHRLALDFSAAAAAFEQADREWSESRKPPDLPILAHISALKGVLWMMRRDYDAATRELDRSCSLYRQSGQTRDEARELITRSTIYIYAGKLGRALKDLNKASGLIDEDEEKELAFSVKANLANALAQAGKMRNAAQEFERAQQLNRAIEVPLGQPKLDWIGGYINERHGDFEGAKRSYQNARSGFRNADQLRYFGLVSADLMLVYSLQERWGRVAMLASEVLPILSSLNFHRETVVTIKALVQALETESFSQQLLADLRKVLRQDPLTM